VASNYVGDIGYFPYPRGASSGFSEFESTWLPCDGRRVAIADYPTLYQLIGKNYGGDGSTYFQVPSIANTFSTDYGDGWYICALGIYPYG
jgi:microcystin-dependent protein